MLYYDRIDIFEGNDVNKTTAPKDCDVCHYWLYHYLLNDSFKLQPNAWNRCHDLLMMSIKLSNFAILKIKGSDYCCVISLMSKNETINLLQNVNSTEKVEHYKKIWELWI